MLKILKNYGISVLGFLASSLINHPACINGKSITCLHFKSELKDFLKKAFKKDGNFKSFSVQNEGHIKRKRVMFEHFQSELKEFSKKSIEKGLKFQSFFNQNRRTYK